MANLDGTDDYFDSREVIERIAELEGTEVIDRDPEEQDELDALYELQEEAEGQMPDWQYGETFINEDSFTDYVEELAKDLGYISADFPDWIAIDWDATADNLKVDYAEFQFMGTTYFARV